MKDYVANVLHTSVQVIESAPDYPLPLYLRESFRYEVWKIGSTTVLVAHPTDKNSITALKNYENKLQTISGLPVVFAFETSTRYRNSRMVEGGIPFIVEGEQIYLPFMGMLIKPGHSAAKRERILPQIDHVSVQTQRFVLWVLYHNVDAINLTQTALALGISKMSATRIFNDLAALNLGFISIRGNVRWFHRGMNRLLFWEKLQPYLFNPIVREYRLEEINLPDTLELSGLSAVSHYSLLNDNDFPTYAIDKEIERQLELKTARQIPQEEPPKVVLQVTRYALDSYEPERTCIDPLSAILSLPKEALDDPRIEGAIETILERVFEHERTRNV